MTLIGRSSNESNGIKQRRHPRETAGMSVKEDVQNFGPC